MKAAIAALSCLLLAGAVSRAADAPPTTDWAMEVVVVHADQQGPALWHVKKGESELWILGTVGLMPKSIAWNTSRLSQVIDGANQVLLQPQASSGILDIFELGWMYLTRRDALSMPDGQTLEPSLQPDLRARFVKARQELGKKASRYEDDSPLVAGFRLIGDFAETQKLSVDVPEQAAEKIARSKHVKVRRVADYDAMPFVREMLKLGPQAGPVCFENALTDYETLSVHAVPAAEAWAVGNVAGIKSHYSTSLLASCARQSKKFGEIDNRAVGDMLKAVHESLSKPGKTVIVIDVGWLFRAGGVAEQLRNEGIVIEGPGE